MSNEEIIAQLKASLTNIESDILAEYRKGRRSSGRFESEMEVIVEQRGKNIIGRLIGSDYAYYVFHGRKAGKYPNIESIRQWVRKKPIISQDLTENQLVYVIARSIAKKGTLEKGVKMLTVLNKSIESNFKGLENTILNTINQDFQKELFEKSKYERKINVM